MPKSLSPRQLECAVLFARGMSAKDIARHIGNSEGTVRKHLQEAYERLGVSGRSAVADALGIDRVGRESPMPPRPVVAPDRSVGEASAASETATDERSLYGLYKALGVWRSPPRPPGGRLTLVVVLAVLSSMAIGTLLLILSTVYALLNSTGSWH